MFFNLAGKGYYHHLIFLLYFLSLSCIFLQNKIIKKGYEILGLDTFFTAGPNELRAWTLKRGSLAPQAAGRIHTDFERGFIKAEIISFEDYISFGGEAGSKENGKLRLEGKDYIFKDGDIAHFKFNV